MTRLGNYSIVCMTCLLLACLMSCKDDAEADLKDEPDTDVEVPSNEHHLQPCFSLTRDLSYDSTTNFPSWQNSPYILPYPIGAAYRVGQGNNTQGSHMGQWRYGYDFNMDIGRTIVAVRGGVVTHAVDDNNDGDREKMNIVMIEHNDGSVAAYLHLTRNGVLVEVGDVVTQGDTIALSGDSGNTGGVPHLHLSIHSCIDLPPGPPDMPTTGDCNSLPIVFSNTDPNPNGLVEGLCYVALE